jgi:hypothetical protein
VIESAACPLPNALPIVAATSTQPRLVAEVLADLIETGGRPRSGDRTRSRDRRQRGFRVNLPHRQSFSPDAAFYVGPDPGMKF